VLSSLKSSNDWLYHVFICTRIHIDATHIHLLPLLRPDPEILGLDGKTLQNLKFIVWVRHLEVKFLDDGRHDEDDFLPGEGATDARTEAEPEGLPGIGLVLFHWRIYGSKEQNPHR
jgi:hypothetical protein